MQPVSPTRWRALPTILIVVVALGLGAVAARADGGTSARAPGAMPAAAR
jgi:hypothetical protein